MAEENGGEKFFIYLTNWSYMIWVVYLIWGACSATATFMYTHFLCKDRFVKKPTEGNRHGYKLIFDDKPTGCCGLQADQTSWHQKVQWVLYNVGIIMALTVSILFWALLYNPQSSVNNVSAVNLMTHAVNGIMALVDLFVTGIPVRLLHMVYPFAFGGAYSVFTGIYHGFNGTNAQDNPYIYSVIDYNNTPGTATGVILGIMFVFTPLVYLVIYALYLVREGLLYLARRHCCGRCFSTSHSSNDFEMMTDKE